MDAQTIIEKLGLQKLPEEGGFFRETYRSTAKADRRNRVCGTDIYYLITPEEFSALHKVEGSDELFNFYAGDPVEMIQINPAGQMAKIVFGTNLLEGQTQKLLVPSGTWQGMQLQKGGKWALFGCSVFPGFEFEDFVVGRREELTALFPQHAESIKRYTRS